GSHALAPLHSPPGQETHDTQQQLTNNSNMKNIAGNYITGGSFLLGLTNNTNMTGGLLGGGQSGAPRGVGAIDRSTPKSASSLNGLQLLRNNSRNSGDPTPVSARNGPGLGAGHGQFGGTRVVGGAGANSNNAALIHVGTTTTSRAGHEMKTILAGAGGASSGGMKMGLDGAASFNPSAFKSFKGAKTSLHPGFHGGGEMSSR
ncbi:unnamed protein product, partial [Amoebophrya sp. A25]